MNGYNIGFFTGPPLGVITDDMLKDAARIGFKTAVPSDVKTKEECLELLGYYERAGIGCIISDEERMKKAIELAKDGKDEEMQAIIREIVGDYRHCKALYEYYVIDEPGASKYEAIAKVVSAINKYDPSHNCYVNLFPNYANKVQLEADTYEEYVEKYVQTVKPHNITYDHYHFMREDSVETNENLMTDRDERLIYEATFMKNERPGFFENLDCVQKISKKYEIPFNIIILLVAHGGYRNITEAEIRFEVFQSLAYGARGISYYTYWTPKVELWNYHDGIIENDGSKTKHYYEVEKVNKDLDLVGTELMDKEHIKTIHASETEDIETCGISFKGAKNLTVGVYEDGYLLLANKNYTDAEICKIYIGTKEVEILNKKTGRTEKIPVENGMVKIKIAAGDGELVLVK